MLKKMISAVVMAAALALPVMLAGCEKDEIKIERQVEVRDAIISQDTVVE